MATTALQLITRSYYLSQIVSRSLQTVSGEQINDGLILLNELLAFKSTDVRLIPYYREFTFNADIGEQKYEVDNLLETDVLTFNIGDVRYSMYPTTRTTYFGQYRIDNIQSLPYRYRIERRVGGSDIYLYFSPSQAFVIKGWGKFALDQVELFTDMSLTYDSFYIEYLRYALAEYICSDWGSTFPDESKQKLKELTKKLMEVSPPDLSVNSANYFGSGIGLDWQMINLSGGWVPY